MDKLQKILASLILSSSFFVPLLAWGQYPPNVPWMNRITYQLSVDKWATTSNAKVTVNMDAIADKIDLSNINAHVLSNLAAIADSKNWHIVRYVRNQDKSGLEMIHVEAEAWLPNNTLGGIRDKAKKISRPGETYTIADIDFSPSPADIENTHAEARATIYNMAKAEIARLQQIYPDQHYFLYSIDFQQPTVFGSATGKMAMTAAMPAPAAPEPVAEINSHIIDSATVVVAAQLPLTGQGANGSAGH